MTVTYPPSLTLLLFTLTAMYSGVNTSGALRIALSLATALSAIALFTAKRARVEAPFGSLLYVVFMFVIERIASSDPVFVTITCPLVGIA